MRFRLRLGQRNSRAEEVQTAAWLANNTDRACRAVERTLESLSTRDIIRLNLVPVPAAHNAKNWQRWLRRLPKPHREAMISRYRTVQGDFSQS